MYCSGVILACGILFSRLASAKDHASTVNHRRALSERQYQSSDSYGSSGSSSYTTYNADSTSSSYDGILVGSQKTASVPAPTAAPVSAAVPATVAAPVPSTPVTKLVCDTARPKFAINTLLVKNSENLKDSAVSILRLTQQVDEDSAQKMADSIAAELQKVNTGLTACLTSIQVCGMDPKPLIANNGVTLSDVSWSAFQITLTLKSVFDSITCLYKPYPAIRTSCSAVLVKISTALASLIAACGEQLNLFDTRFFPLVTPQLKEFMQVEENFSSFIGPPVAEPKN